MTTRRKRRRRRRTRTTTRTTRTRTTRRRRKRRRARRRRRRKRRRTRRRRAAAAKLDEDGFALDEEGEWVELPAPYDDDEYNSVEPLLWYSAGDTQPIDGGKLEFEAESHEWCLPELLGELLELGFFLNGFAPLLELRGGARRPDPRARLALGGAHLCTLAVRVHLALVALLTRHPRRRRAERAPALAAAMRRLTPLGWREAVADAVVWLTDGAAVRRPGEVCQGTPYAAAVLTLRTGERVARPPRASRSPAALDRAAAMNLVREASNAASSGAMRWVEEAAAASAAPRRSRRRRGCAPSRSGATGRGGCTTCCRGRCGRRGRETVCWTSLDDMHTVSGLFEKSRATPRSASTALSTTLADGTVASHQRKFAFERADDNDAPAPSSSLSLPTRRGGRRGRRSWRRTWRRGVRPVAADHAARLLADGREGLRRGGRAHGRPRRALPHLLHIEAGLPESCFTDGWGDARPAWVAAVSAAEAAEPLAPLLLQLEAAMARDTLSKKWTAPAFSPEVMAPPPAPGHLRPAVAAALTSRGTPGVPPPAAGEVRPDKGPGCAAARVDGRAGVARRPGRRRRPRGGRAAAAGRADAEEEKRQRHFGAVEEQRQKERKEAEDLERKRRIEARTKRLSGPEVPAEAEDGSPARKRAKAAEKVAADLGTQCVRDARCVKPNKHKGKCNFGKEQVAAGCAGKGKGKGKAAAPAAAAAAGGRASKRKRGEIEPKEEEEEEEEEEEAAAAGRRKSGRRDSAAAAKAKAEPEEEEEEEEGEGEEEEEGRRRGGGGGGGGGRGRGRVRVRGRGGEGGGVGVRACGGDEHRAPPHPRHVRVRHHTYCAKPPLEAVPEGEWHCDVCVLQRGLHARLGEIVANSALVREDLCQPAHPSSEIWRQKCAVARSSAQLLLLLRELVEALDRPRLRPLIDEAAEATRREDQELRARQREEKRAAREEERRQRLGYARGERECALAIERCIKHLEKAEKREGRNEGRAALRAQKEEAKKAKQDAKRERLESRVEGEVRRCVDKLIAKVERADARAKAQAEGSMRRRRRSGGGPSAEWFYLSCDACEKWVHGRCVGVRPRDIDLLLRVRLRRLRGVDRPQVALVAQARGEGEGGEGGGGGAARDALPSAGVGGVCPEGEAQARHARRRRVARAGRPLRGRLRRPAAALCVGRGARERLVKIRINAGETFTPPQTRRATARAP